MSGIPESLASDLSRYFERKLTVKGDVVACEPIGYKTELEKKLDHAVVLRHAESGIRICCDPVDLVERVDFKKLPGPTRVVFLYLDDVKVFKLAAKVARTQPRDALAIFIDNGLLSPSSAPAVDEDGEPIDGELAWYRGFSCLEPPSLFFGAGGPKRGSACGSLCFALFVLEDYCRQLGAEDSLEMLDLRDAVQDPEVNWGVHLIHAASQRDVAGVRYYLEKGADPNFADCRGWTALHTAVSWKRPCWPVLDILLEVCDVCAQTRNGERPVDLAEKCNQASIMDALNQKMLVHPVGQHVVRDTKPLITNHLGADTRQFPDLRVL